MSSEKAVDLVAIKTEVESNLSDAAVRRSLLATTFNGLNDENMRKAVFEGMMRGYTIRDFLAKDIYAVPFGRGYALVNSIGHARKTGMRNGVCGKDEPIYTYKDPEQKKIHTCSITIRRQVNGIIGSYSAKVFFDEYTTGKGNWVSKPHTMIAKVAEVHALRMACPEDMSLFYTEEEFMKAGGSPIDAEEVENRLDEQKTALEECTSIEMLDTVWKACDLRYAKELKPVRDAMREKLSAKVIDAPQEGAGEGKGAETTEEPSGDKETVTEAPVASDEASV